MRTCWKWALILAVPALWVTAARPADQQIVPEGTTVPLLLLRQNSVQQELKLTPDDAKKILEFTNKQYEAFQQALKLSAAEREAKLDQMEKANKQFLADTLTAGQHKRLDQITLQATGLMQLTRPEIVNALNLTEEQQQKFKQLQQEARKGLRDLIQTRNKDELAKRRQETRTKIMAILTDEQKAKVRELVGAPFEGEIVFEKHD